MTLPQKSIVTIPSAADCIPRPFDACPRLWKEASLCISDSYDYRLCCDATVIDAERHEYWLQADVISRMRGALGIQYMSIWISRIKRIVCRRKESYFSAASRVNWPSLWAARLQRPVGTPQPLFQRPPSPKRTPCLRRAPRPRRHWLRNSS